MKITDFNKGNKYTIDTKGFEYKDLESIEDMSVRGFFINSKSKYGEQAVMITDNCYVNLPRHLINDIKCIIQNDELTKEINKGSIGAKRYSYIGNDGHEYYSIRWYYVNGNIS